MGQEPCPQHGRRLDLPGGVKNTENEQYFEHILDLPVSTVMSTSQLAEDFASLSPLSSIKIEYLGLADAGQIEEFSGVPPFLRHVAVLQEHKQLAESIPNDISSAKTYSGDKQLLFLLLDNKGQPEIVLYDVAEQQLLSLKEDEILNLIACPIQAPVAEVDPDQVERLAQRAKKYWMVKRQMVQEQDISRICALYLVPEKRELGLGRILEKRAAV